MPAFLTQPRQLILYTIIQHINTTNSKQYLTVNKYTYKKMPFYFSLLFLDRFLRSRKGPARRAIKIYRFTLARCIPKRERGKRSPFSVQICSLPSSLVAISVSRLDFQTEERRIEIEKEKINRQFTAPPQDVATFALKMKPAGSKE